MATRSTNSLSSPRTHPPPLNCKALHWRSLTASENSSPLVLTSIFGRAHTWQRRAGKRVASGWSEAAERAYITRLSKSSMLLMEMAVASSRRSSSAFASLQGDCKEPMMTDGWSAQD